VRSGVDKTTKAAEIVGSLGYHMYSHRAAEYYRVLGGPTTAKDIDPLLKAQEDGITKGLDEYGAVAFGPQDRKLADQFRTTWAAYLKQIDGLYDLPQDQGVKVLQTGTLETIVPLITAIEKWQTIVDKEAVKAGSASDSATTSARTIIFILLGIAILLAAALAYVISRSIGRSATDVLDRLSHLRREDTSSLRGGLEALAQGDLTVEAQATTEPIERITGDELGRIAVRADRRGQDHRRLGHERVGRGRHDLRRGRPRGQRDRLRRVRGGQGRRGPGADGRRRPHLG
jgi:hypothetical protein